MSFEYHWAHNEANFGPPIQEQVSGGTHITFEIIPTFEGSFIALRRPEAIPNHQLPPGAEEHPKGLLYFCHNLIRYGESVRSCVERTVKQQAGVGIAGFRVLEIDSEVQEKDGQWAFTPHVVAELSDLPTPSDGVVEVVQFTRHDIPNDFGWWSKEELLEFINEYALDTGN